MGRMFFVCAALLLCGHLVGAVRIKKKLSGSFAQDEDNSTLVCNRREKNFFLNAKAFGMIHCSGNVLTRKDAFTFEAKINGEEVHLGQSVGLLGRGALASFMASQPFCGKGCSEYSCSFNVQFRVIQHASFNWEYPCGDWSDVITVEAPIGERKKAEWDGGDDFRYHVASVEFQSTDSAPDRDAPPPQPEINRVGARQTVENTMENETRAVSLERDGDQVSEKCQRCATNLCERVGQAKSPPDIMQATIDVCVNDGCKADCPAETDSWTSCAGVIANCEPDALNDLKRAKLQQLVDELQAAAAAKESRIKAEEPAAEAACAYFRTQKECGIKETIKGGEYKLKVKDSGSWTRCKQNCMSKNVGEHFECELQYGKKNHKGENTGDMGFIQGNSTNCKLGAQYWFDAQLKGTLPPGCENAWIICDPYDREGSTSNENKGVPACPPPRVNLDGTTTSQYSFMRGVSCISKRKPHRL
jgi:hypothetical protein